MGHLAGYDETTAVYVETRQDALPSQDELLDANETLARVVSVQATKIQMLEIELAAMKRLLQG
jgi:hypothetical protein